MTADDGVFAQRTESGSASRGQQANGGAAVGSAPSAEMARFSLLYESRDGRLCLFQDADGHLVAVDASKLV